MNYKKYPALLENSRKNLLNVFINEVDRMWYIIKFPITIYIMHCIFIEYQCCPIFFGTVRMYCKLYGVHSVW